MQYIFSYSFMLNKCMPLILQMGCAEAVIEDDFFSEDNYKCAYNDDTSRLSLEKHEETIDKLPIEWATKIKKILTMPVPSDIHTKQWNQIKYDMLKIVHGNMRLIIDYGYSFLDIFGCWNHHPLFYNSSYGLILCIRNGRIYDINPDYIKFLDSFRNQRKFRRGRLDANIQYMTTLDCLL